MRVKIISPTVGNSGGEGKKTQGKAGRSASRMVAGMSELVCDTQRLTARTRRGEGRRVRLPNVLSIGLDEGQQIEGIAQVTVRRPREVIEMLRVLHFNLLLVRASAKDVATWQMLALVHQHWPRLRWVLLADEACTDREEILARSLGATSVTADPRVIAELASGRVVTAV